MRKVRIAGVNSRTSTVPVPHFKTVRRHDITVLTSMPAGRMTPIAAIPVLREDSARTRINLAVQMMETADILINPIDVTVSAYLVPYLSLDRFTSMDDLARSYAKEPPRPNLPVTPFFRVGAAAAHGANAVHKYLGLHAKEGSRINAAYTEAYNKIWNLRAANRSSDLTLRDEGNGALAPAFWHHERFSHIVPRWDQAVMDGNVPLNVVAARMPIRGMAFGINTATNGPVAGGVDGDNTHRVFERTASFGEGIANNQIHVDFRNNAVNVFAELQQNGITVSLANIQQARMMQSFAKLREQFVGHDDDYIIDQLMAGFSIPDQMWRQPMLLAQQHTQISMAKRYATSGGDLTESVVNGAAMVSLNFGSPKCPCGGIIMVVAEATPGQLFERGADPLLHTTDTLDLPNAYINALDPEPVEAVRNDYIDTDHTAPASTFGYAPMNHRWNNFGPRVGGRFFRPKVDAAFSEDRVRLWAVEQKDPVLSRHFYLAEGIHTKPFVNPGQDPFEVVAQGESALTGLTQFGPTLIEAQGNYDAVKADAPKDRLPAQPK